MNKLKTIFSITMTASILLVVVVSSLIASSMNRKSIEIESSRLLETTANYAAMQLEYELEKYEAQVEMIASQMSEHYQLHTGSPEEKRSELLVNYDFVIRSLSENNDTSVASYTLMNHNLYNDLISDQAYPYQIVYTRNENETSRLNNNLVTVNDLSSQEDYMNWYLNPLNLGYGSWSQIYHDNFLDKTIITYSSPIVVENQIIGMVGIDIEFEAFNQLISDIRVYETGYAFLFDSQFNYLVHPIHTFEENLETIFNGQYAYMKQLFLEDTTGIIHYYYNQQDKVLAFSHLSNGWIVAVAPPIEEVYYFYNDLRYTQFLIIFIASILAIIISWIVGSLISKPFHNVAIDIQQVDVNDLKVVDLEDNHFIYEVNIINKNFAGFAERLSNAINEISNQNKHLEDQVQLRTIDIKKSNEKLKHYIHELETTQDLLVQAQKEKEINTLIKNIAHNMNTPLGTAITTYSFLDNILDQDDPKVKTSIKIITDSLQEMRRIIDGLNLLTSDHKKLSSGQVNIKTVIESRFNWLKLQHSKYKLSLNQIDRNVEVINSNKKLLINLFDLLFEYTIHHYDINEIDYSINLSRIDSHIQIEFSDNTLNFDKIKQFYDHKDMSHLDLSVFDLDIYLLHAVVESLNGHIKVINNKGKVKWLIQLQET